MVTISKEDIINEIRLLLSKDNIDPESDLTLTSLQTIKLVSKIEKKFQIELADRYIFRGIFRNLETLCSYILFQIGDTESVGWKESVCQSIEIDVTE